MGTPVANPATLKAAALVDRVRSGDKLIAFLRRSRFPAVKLGMNEQNLPVLAFKLGGRRKPAIFIKAGSHASEIGAIYGALRLLEEGIASDHEIYLVACVCPQDFAGYNHLLGWASGKKVQVRTDTECRQTLDRLGQRFFRQPGFALYRVGDMVFAHVDQRKVDPRALAYIELDRHAKADPHLAQALAGRRVVFPNSVFYHERATNYDQAAVACCVNWDGWVGNPNRFYDNFDPPFDVRCIRDFCEQIKPGLVIDMHESGFIRNSDVLGTWMAEQHYLVLPPIHGPGFEPLEKAVAEGALSATRKAGFPPLSRRRLATGWRFGQNVYYEGYVRSDQRPTIAFYQWGMRYEASIVIESGMNQPTAVRASIQEAAVRGAVAAYERLKGRHRAKH